MNFNNYNIELPLLNVVTFDAYELWCVTGGASSGLKRDIEARYSNCKTVSLRGALVKPLNFSALFCTLNCSSITGKS